jgi:voltage-gated potassium channel
MPTMPSFTRVANSPGLLVLVFVFIMTTASALYAVFEDASFLDSLYWSVVTATTLGYGDFSPHSESGKVLTSVLIVATVFLFIPTITANLASKLIVNRDAFTHEEQEEIKETLQAILVRLDAQASET